MTAQTDVFMHSRNGGLTQEEYFDLNDQLHEAKDRGDEKEYERILRLIPIDADVAKAAKDVWGKEFVLSAGFDLTEADMKFGEGWLDEKGWLDD